MCTRGEGGRGHMRERGGRTVVLCPVSTRGGEGGRRESYAQGGEGERMYAQEEGGCDHETRDRSAEVEVAMDRSMEVAMETWSAATTG